MNQPQNIWRFLGLLISDPVEFFDRAEILLLARKGALFNRRDSADYPKKTSLTDGLQTISDALQKNLSNILDEPELRNVQHHVAELTSRLEVRGNLPFPIRYNADPALAQLAYLLCRALQPENVLETGVGYGVTSAVILAALHKNRKGMLHSIDLPPLGDRSSRAYIGILVPEEYKDHWRLHLGPSKRILPKLFGNGLGEIGVFAHDSANLSSVQKMELDQVWPHLAPRAAMLLNNVGGKIAFLDFVKGKNVDCWLAIEQAEKRGDLAGIVLKR